MTKEELKALKEQKGLEFVRNPITREITGLYIELPEEDGDLEILTDFDRRDPVVAVKTYLDIIIRYDIYAPRNWFDLWGIK